MVFRAFVQCLTKSSGFLRDDLFFVPSAVFAFWIWMKKNSGLQLADCSFDLSRFFLLNRYIHHYMYIAKI